MSLAPAQSNNITLDFFANYIGEIVHHLMQASENNDSHKHSQNNNCENIQLESTQIFSILLITNNDLALLLSEKLNNLFEQPIQGHNVNITSIDISNFLQLPYSQRYDLACFFDPSLLENLLLRAPNLETENINADATKTDYLQNIIKQQPIKKIDSNNDSNNANKHDITTIAIKLRDLFAHQSLLFIDKNLQNINLNQLGFSSTDIDCYIDTKINSEDKTNIGHYNSMSITCWQFNLYDYKPKPDWLNARFWANPENFDKFRW